jgi:hypothetical protein
VLGALLFWLPVAGLVAVAWISRKRAGFAGSFALAIVASAPGLYVVNATGWAILRGPLLPLWFLVCGIAYSQLGSARWALWINRNRRVATQSTTQSPPRHAPVPAYAAHGQVSIRPSWPRMTRW